MTGRRLEHRPPTISQKLAASTPTESARDARIRRQVAAIRHQIEIDNLVGEAYEVIEFVLTNDERNPELASRTAWRVLENSGAPVYSEKRLEVVQVGQFNVHQSEKADQAVQTLIDSIARTTTGGEEK